MNVKIIFRIMAALSRKYDTGKTITIIGRDALGHLVSESIPEQDEDQILRDFKALAINSNAAEKF